MLEPNQALFRARTPTLDTSLPRRLTRKVPALTNQTTKKRVGTVRADDPLRLGGSCRPGSIPAELARRLVIDAAVGGVLRPGSRAVAEDQIDWKRLGLKPPVI